LKHATRRKRRSEIPNTPYIIPRRMMRVNRTNLKPKKISPKTISQQQQQQQQQRDN